MQSNAFDIHASSMENVFISISGMIGAGKTTVSYCNLFFLMVAYPMLNTYQDLRNLLSWTACKCVGEPSRSSCLPRACNHIDSKIIYLVGFYVKFILKRLLITFTWPTFIKKQKNMLSICRLFYRVGYLL